MGRPRTVGPLRKTQKPNEETNEQSRSRQPAESGRPTRSEAWTAARAEAGTGWPTARRQQAWPAAAEIVTTGEPQRAIVAALILAAPLLWSARLSLFSGTNLVKAELEIRRWLRCPPCAPIL